MKFLKIFSLLMMLSIGAQAQFTKAEVQVSGLTCSMCSKSTEKALRTLGFIADVKPDLNRNLFVLTFKSNEAVNLDQISKKVQNAGFSVSNLKATFNLTSKLNNNTFSYAGDTFLVVNAADKASIGPLVFTVVDKGFAPASVYKKYAVQTPPDNKTGKVYRVII